MATFTNTATLSYNGIQTNSNTTTGELVAVLSASKIAVTDSYEAGQSIAYVINLVNTGTTILTGIEISDNLGAYLFNETSLVPLSYVAGSIRYYANGILQIAPTVTAGPPLVISGIMVPAGGNATILYAAETNEFAPLAPGSTITNTATVTSESPAIALTAEETVTAQDTANLSIAKTISPDTITAGNLLTYTFIIQNSGNAPVTVADLVTITDDFDPALDPIAVRFNGVAWSPVTNYTYNNVTGAFATVAGQVTVPAATFTRDAVTGDFTIVPGVSILEIKGTV